MSAKQKQRPAAAKEGVPSVERLVARHLAWGWWSLALFLALGLVLEVLHGLKADLYLNVAYETRRFMWTLSHAHGSLLGLVHLGFAATLRAREMPAARSLGFASLALVGATVLLPTGFFLGGVEVHGGDPGRGVLLVPFGAVLAIAAAVVVALRAARR